MAQPIQDFDAAVSRNLALRIVCGRCAREVLIAARSLRGWVKPGADIESIAFRCEGCGASAAKVRCCEVFGGRESLSSWTPPARPAPYG